LRAMAGIVLVDIDHPHAHTLRVRSKYTAERLRCDTQYSWTNHVAQMRRVRDLRTVHHVCWGAQSGRCTPCVLRLCKRPLWGLRLHSSHRIYGMRRLFKVHYERHTTFVDRLHAGVAVFQLMLGFTQRLLWRSDDSLGHTFGCTAGLYAAEAVELLQKFYFQGNPRGELFYCSDCRLRSSVHTKGNFVCFVHQTFTISYCLFKLHISEERFVTDCAAPIPHRPLRSDNAPLPVRRN
jgi:hypothetical protein